MTALSAPSCPSSILIDENGLCDWLADAKPGDSLVYYRGHLGHDRMPSTKALPEVQRRDLCHAAARIRQAAEDGRVHLLQRRHGDNDFSYLAIKSAPRRRQR